MTADEGSARIHPEEGESRQRRGHRLRSEEEIRKSHNPPVAELLLATRRLIVGAFGERGPLAKLADAVGKAHPGRPPGFRRKLARQFSEQMSKRSVKGPAWDTLEYVLTYGVADEYRNTERLRLEVLYRQARGETPPDTAILDVGAPGEAWFDDEVRRLTVRNVELRSELEAAREEVKRLRLEVEYEKSAERVDKIHLVAQLAETHERYAQLACRAAMVPDFSREHAMTLPSSSRSLRLTIDDSAPPKLLGIATYLRVLCELGRYTVEGIAESSKINPEVIERTLTARDLPSYPDIAAIGSAVNANPDFLLQLFFKAEPAAEEWRQRATTTWWNLAFDSLDFDGATTDTVQLPVLSPRPPNFDGFWPTEGRPSGSRDVGLVYARLQDKEPIYLPGGHLEKLQLRDANLRRAFLSRARLQHADLTRTDLRDAYLVGADLENADLTGSSLQRAQLARAKLVRAKLAFADLRHANLAFANLRGADLTRTELSDANLAGADLTGTAVTVDQLVNARVTEETALPQTTWITLQRLRLRGLQEQPTAD